MLSEIQSDLAEPRQRNVRVKVIRWLLTL